MTCTTPTWIWKGEHTVLVDATVAFTGYNTTNQTASYTINLPWGDTRDLSLHINEKKEYADPYSNMVWSIVASVYDNIEDRVKVVCCHEIEQLEATHVLILYFKPWSWVNVDSALAALSSSTMEIAGELSNVFSGISGYEYVSHEIVYETPEGSAIPLIGIKIYVYSDGAAQPFAIPILVYPILLALIAIFGALMNPVAEAWGEIAYMVEMHPILVKKVEKLDAEVVRLLHENAELRVASGEMTPEELVAWIDGLIARDSELNSDFLAKNGWESHDRYAACLDDAKTQYLADGDMDNCVAAVAVCIDTRLAERKTETEENYGDDDFVDLDFGIDTFMEDMLKYAKYGLLALGAIMLAKAAID